MATTKMTGRAVRRRREQLGLTLKEVAAAFGISESYLSRVERQLLTSPRLSNATEVFERLEKK